MNTTTLVQPETQLGQQIEDLLDAGTFSSRIVFVSAFTSLRTLLRLRERLLRAAQNETMLRFTVGVDLGGTSREVLEELVRWDCEVFVYHNPIVRATFHPKIYLFEGNDSAVLVVGSNNLTDGGLYTNYEAAIRHDFAFPIDTAVYERILTPLLAFVEPDGPTVCRLSNDLIHTLSERGLVPTETEARRSRRPRQGTHQEDGQEVPPNPFTAVAVPMPPLLPRDLRAAMPEGPAENGIEAQEEILPPTDQPRPEGVLVWKKKLPRTDALQVNPDADSHPVGGVRLTQARFENPVGQRIDQTTYFRRLFDDYDWEREPSKHPDQEHTFVPMRIFIRGNDFGVRNFEISHKPSGESGQDNYTTILRWGRDFNATVIQENLTDTILSLYETPDAEVGFLLDISEA